MIHKTLMVIVTARPHANLEILARSDGPLVVPCGSLGTGLARSVLEGNGRALIPATSLRAAFDTQDGVNALFDNFEFTVEHTLSPMIFELLKPSL